MGDRSAHNGGERTKPFARAQPRRSRRWGWRMEVKEELGPRRVRRPGGPNRMYFSFVLCVRSFLFVRRFRGEGDQGALLGSIRSIWDRIWSCLKIPPLLR